MRFTLLFALASAQSTRYDDGYNVTEEYIPNNIKAEMYTRTWVPLRKPVANVVFVHGQAEYINRYNHVFSEFAKAGIKVHSFDQMGCGLTGKRANNLGGAMGMERVKLDIDDAIDRIDDKKTPLFLMGHSFGGETTMDYLARGNRRHLLYGALATSPDLALAPETRPYQVLVPGLIAIARGSPQFRIDTNLVRDTVVGGHYILDGGYRNIQVPRLMIVHGSGDKITSYPTSERIANILKNQGKSKSVEFKGYHGGYHELHNDIIKDEVIANHVKWFLSQVGN
ncbi:hypothetical protein DSO57_1017209 [Entomophthora muscae]|uniref:Uncharacterized protein n=1 Tax=Entomophthora muscae TaxID=34485 RepID=A0ACC2T4J4_9FUNG|nr:hypothetical protein DSO57_1017209 [Entomophthora muscae]